MAANVASLQQRVSRTKAIFEELALDKNTTSDVSALRMRQQLNFSLLGHDCLGIMQERHIEYLARVLLGGPGIGRGVTDDVVLRGMRTISDGQEPRLEPQLEAAGVQWAPEGACCLAKPPLGWPDA